MPSKIDRLKRRVIDCQAKFEMASDPAHRQHRHKILTQRTRLLKLAMLRAGLGVPSHPSRSVSL